MGDSPANIWDAVSALSTMATAGIAVWGVTSWRHEAVGRRRIESAEQFLEAVYEAQERMEAIRSPAIWSGESSKLEEIAKGENYNNSLHWLAALERLRDSEEFFSKFFSFMFRAKAIFGKKGAEPFEKICRARHLVRVSAGMLARAETGELERELRRKLEADVWGSHGDEKPSEVTTLIADAVAGAEQTFGGEITSVKFKLWSGMA